MTSFSEVITNYGMSFIDDEDWNEQLKTNPAQFFRAKSQVLIVAIPRFNRPYNIREYLKYTSPVYDDYEYVVESSASSFVINTGKTGYELCSAGHISTDANNNISYTPLECSYVSATGVATVTGNVPSGDSIVLDFYTDGTFDNELTEAQKRILGLCMSVDWYYKFSNSQLNVANLITDKTFNLRSPSEHIRVSTDRYKLLYSTLSAELMAYEQSCFAAKVVPNEVFPILQ